MSVIAEGFSLRELAQFDPDFRPGERVTVSMQLTRPLTQAEIRSLVGGLVGQGVSVVGVEQDDNVLALTIERHSPFLIPLAFAGIGVLVAGWKITSEIKKIPTLAWVAALGVIGLVGYWMVWRK